MINTGVISYGVGAILFLVLTLVLLTGQQGRSRKNALKFAAVVSTVWLGFTAATIYYDVSFYAYLVEPVRSFSLLLFLGFKSSPERRSASFATNAPPRPMGNGFPRPKL